MNPRLRYGLEAVFFVAIAVSFFRNAAQGGFFAVGAAVAVLLRGGLAGAFAVRGPEGVAMPLRRVATGLLFLAGLILVVGSAYSLFFLGTSAPVVHGLLGVLGLGLLAYGVVEGFGQPWNTLRASS